MDQLFTINVTPDETARLNKTFQSSDILKVDWDEKHNTSDDEVIGVYLNAITEQDTFDIADFISTEHAESYKNIRQNIRQYIFTCFKNDGLLEVEENRNIKEEMDNFIKNNEGGLRINLKKKKLIKNIEPFYYKDRHKNNRPDAEENRYYSKDVEEEEKKRKKEEEMAAYEKGEKDRLGDEELGDEDDENIFEHFEEMINNTLIKESSIDRDTIMDPLKTDNTLTKHEQKDNSDEKNSKYMKQDKSPKQKVEEDNTLNEVKNEIYTTNDEMGETKKQLIHVGDEIKEGGETISVKDNENMKDKDKDKDKHKQTENSKKRKIQSIGENDNGTGIDAEEIAKKGKIIKNTNDENKGKEKISISNIVMTEFRKNIKEWITFFPHINVENFFFHLYFLVELWRDKKRACVHCGSTDCEIDEFNKSICSNMYCFLCDKKMIEGVPCHNIRTQFITLRRFSIGWIKNPQARYAFDRFGATCFRCSSCKHQICGAPPNVEGAKTIDFRAFRIFEAKLYKTIYAKDPFFIWDVENSEYNKKVELIINYLANKRINTKQIGNFPNQGEEGGCRTRKYSLKTGNIFRGKGSFDERCRRIFYEEQREKKSNEVGRNERNDRYERNGRYDRNERHDQFERHDRFERCERNYNIEGKNKNFNELKYVPRDNKGMHSSISNTGVSVNYKTTGELDYSKNNNTESFNTYPMDVTLRRNVNLMENNERHDYKKKDNLQRNNKNNVTNNIHMEGQHVVYKNPLFYRVENLEHPIKQKKWNFVKKEMNKGNNFENINANATRSSKYRFFSSNSGKMDQNEYTGMAHGNDKNVRIYKPKHDQYKHDQYKHDQYKHDQHKHDQYRHDPYKRDQHKHDQNKYDQNKHDQNKHDQKYNERKNNFNNYNMDSFHNTQKGLSPIYKNVKVTNDFSYDQFFYGGNKNEKTYEGNNGMENYDNRTKGIYKNNQNTGKYKNKQNYGDVNCYNNSVNFNSCYNRGRGNDRNSNYNKHSLMKGNIHMQKNENDFRNNNNNKSGNNDSCHKPNAPSLYRTKSNGSKKN